MNMQDIELRFVIRPSEEVQQGFVKLERRLQFRKCFLDSYDNPRWVDWEDVLLVEPKWEHL
jgi:hypothetical protein